MTHQEFFSSIAERKFAPVYLWSGQEEFVKQRALEKLRAALLPEGLEQLNENVMDNPTAGDVLDAMDMLPMMAERRLLIVRDSALLMAGRARDEAVECEKLLAGLAKAPDTACVVFYCHGMPDGRKKCTTGLSKLAVTVRFDPLGDAELAQWMRGTLKPLGKKISAENVELLSFTCGRDLSVLSGELAKLAAYKPDVPEVSAEDIAQLATPSLECTVFQMTDALVAHRETDVFRLLASMLERGESRIGILAMILRQYRQLLYMRLMQNEGRKQPEIQKVLGIPAFAVRRTAQQASRYTDAALYAAVDLCVETDFAIKSGRMHDDAALSRAIFRLLAL